jgi:hypothetical protein
MVQVTSGAVFEAWQGHWQGIIVGKVIFFSQSISSEAKSPGQFS